MNGVRCSVKIAPSPTPQTGHGPLCFDTQQALLSSAGLGSMASWCQRYDMISISAALVFYAVSLANAWKCLVVSRLCGQLRYANASFWTNLVLHIAHCAGYSLPLLRHRTRIMLHGRLVKWLVKLSFYLLWFKLCHLIGEFITNTEECRVLGLASTNSFSSSVCVCLSLYCLLFRRINVYINCKLLAQLSLASLLGRKIK